MGVLEKRFVLYRVLLEVSSVVLAVLLYLFIVSGYGLIEPSAVERYSLGLLSYDKCIRLHLSPLVRWLLILSGLVHGYCGFALMSLRIRRRRVRMLIEAILAVLCLLVFIQLLLIELT